MAEQTQVAQSTKAGDSERLSRAQVGDMSAFEELVELHRDSVYSLGLRMTRSETDATEIAQESFLSACLHLGEFQEQAEFVAWIHRIAANRAVMRLRQRSPEASREELESPELDECGTLGACSATDWSRAADERALSAGLRDAIEEATNRLPPAHREDFLLKDVAGLSYEQIADITGHAIPAIRSRLHEARLTLRKTIERFYGKE